MRHTAVAALLLLPLLGVTGCSRGAEPTAEASTRTPTPTSAKTGTLSVKEAGSAYLRMVDASNKDLDACMKIVNRIAEEQAANGEDVNKVRSACRKAPAANRAFADELDKHDWPTKVR
ncbi:MAG TPA: hypothetical protein VNS49_16170, partial [Streptomyces sp.]|nr:hypothetical protein [Streptomyces sp.]